MKRCPKCNLKYDETLSFCLEDGTALVGFNDPEETLVLHWATGLETCGGGWRLPSLREIRTLYDLGWLAATGYYTSGQHQPAHMDAVFHRLGGGSWIWSDQQTSDGNAHSFNMNQGKAVEYSAVDTVFSTGAFAVRRVRN
jgi:hypothetical protein